MGEWAAGTVNMEEEKRCRVGSLSPHRLAAMMADTASSKNMMKSAPVSGGKLEMAALMISRRDVTRFTRRITRKARNSLSHHESQPRGPALKAILVDNAV